MGCVPPAVGGTPPMASQPPRCKIMHRTEVAAFLPFYVPMDEISPPILYITPIFLIILIYYVCQNEFPIICLTLNLKITYHQVPTNKNQITTHIYILTILYIVQQLLNIMYNNNKCICVSLKIISLKLVVAVLLFLVYVGVTNVLCALYYNARIYKKYLEYFSTRLDTLSVVNATISWLSIVLIVCLLPLVLALKLWLSLKPKWLPYAMSCLSCSSDPSRACDASFHPAVTATPGVEMSYLKAENTLFKQKFKQKPSCLLNRFITQGQYARRAVSNARTIYPALLSTLGLSSVPSHVNISKHLKHLLRAFRPVLVPLGGSITQVYGRNGPTNENNNGVNP